MVRKVNMEIESEYFRFLGTERMLEIEIRDCGKEYNTLLNVLKNYISVVSEVYSSNDFYINVVDTFPINSPKNDRIRELYNSRGGFIENIMYLYINSKLSSSVSKRVIIPLSSETKNTELRVDLLNGRLYTNNNKICNVSQKLVEVSKIFPEFVRHSPNYVSKDLTLFGLLSSDGYYNTVHGWISWDVASILDIKANRLLTFLGRGTKRNYPWLYFYTRTVDKEIYAFYIKDPIWLYPLVEPIIYDIDRSNICFEDSQANKVKELWSTAKKWGLRLSDDQQVRLIRVLKEQGFEKALELLEQSSGRIKKQNQLDNTALELIEKLQSDLYLQINGYDIVYFPTEPALLVAKNRKISYVIYQGSDDTRGSYFASAVKKVIKSLLENKLPKSFSSKVGIVRNDSAMDVITHAIKYTIENIEHKYMLGLASIVRERTPAGREYLKVRMLYETGKQEILKKQLIAIKKALGEEVAEELLTNLTLELI